VGYKVINEFIEKEHENVLYKQGEVYPKEGFEADLDRVAFLQKSDNKYKKAFLGLELESVENDESKKVKQDSELDDGEKVGSKNAASKKKSSTKK
jgi:hypothetical protein